MKEFTIGKNDAGQRLDRWLAKTLPLLPAPLAQKYIRLKRVKVNGKGAKRDVRLAVGDLLQLYINDEFFERPTPENAFLSLYQPKLNILYEDEHILLVDKRPGLVVHPDENERVNTLLTHIQAYLYQKKEWSPYWENSFAPALCNRIDRNTGGIVIAAKTAEGLRVMNQKIKDRELEKRYLCVIHGTMPQREGKLEGYLWKDEVKKQVYVRSKPVPGAKTAVTLYRTLAVRNSLSLVECDLITIRSAPSSPPPAIPCWGTASTAASGTTGGTAAMGRLCTPTVSPSTSPPAPAPWSHSTAAAGRWRRGTLYRSIFPVSPCRGQRDDSLMFCPVSP